MAASAGTILLRGVSGKTYTVDLYIPDAVATYLTFNGNGAAAATSPNDYRIPEDCVFEDISTAAAPTATGASLIVDSAAINGGTLRWANQLAANPNRPKFAVGLRKGSIVSWLQH